MKALKLKASSSIKLLKNELELSSKDIEDVPKSLTPGEWIIIEDDKTKRKYVGYINPHAENFHNLKVLKYFKYEWKPNKNDDELACEIILENILRALEKRSLFKNYQDGSRLVYGNADAIPGLIVDAYLKYILIQINTAGLDKYRDYIKKIFQDKFINHRVILFDNEAYRKYEILPTHENEKIQEDLDVVENGIKYKISYESLQKIGFYYDHRENRLKLKRKIEELNLNYKNGLDLFSYVGSWGLHLLSAGVEHVEFVDQGNMEASVNMNLNLNNFKDRGTFIRKDVFKYLDEMIGLHKKFDVVVSDPPAFTKSEKNKNAAISGYEKLHQKALKLVNSKGLFVAASCTHYVDLNELDKTVQDAAIKNDQKIQMIDVGIQGHDHPMNGFRDKSFYIKYLLYIVE